MRPALTAAREAVLQQEKQSRDKEQLRSECEQELQELRNELEQARIEQQEIKVRVQTVEERLETMEHTPQALLAGLDEDRRQATVAGKNQQYREQDPATGRDKPGCHR